MEKRFGDEFYLFQTICKVKIMVNVPGKLGEKYYIYCTIQYIVNVSWYLLYSFIGRVRPP